MVKSVYFDGKIAGAICSRTEYKGFIANIYLTTLCVSRNYRNMGLGIK
jgi:ribosomal protein S18 acetylase RimI-like enzyme